MEARPVSRWRASGLRTTTAARVDKVTGVQALSLAKRRSLVGVCFLFLVDVTFILTEDARLLDDYRYAGKHTALLSRSFLSTESVH
jgi:DNA integrity scanning protein DisA with diadenylate cyclase activity